MQRAVAASGRTVAGDVLSGLHDLNDDEESLGSFGAVVGATIGSTSESLVIHGPLLVPGIGAQGGSAEDIKRVFAGVLHTVVPSSSREILAPDQTPRDCEASLRTNAELRTLLSAD